MAVYEKESSDAQEQVGELEAENSRLKHLYAEQALEIHALKDVIAKKHWDR